MPIAFIKKPANGGPPLININGHSIPDATRYILAISRTIGAKRITVPVVRLDLIFPKEELELFMSDSLPLDCAILTSGFGVIVANIFGLPVTGDMIDREERRRKQPRGARDLT